MSDSMFQKDFNDEIFVRDLNIVNPCPGSLLMRPNDPGNGQIFYAAPHWVLKSVYSDLNSLAAFGSDTSVTYYALYSRSAQGKDVVFIEHEEGSNSETLTRVGYDNLKEDAQVLVPTNLRP